jgi:hypothetical protein
MCFHHDSHHRPEKFKMIEDQILVVFADGNIRWKRVTKAETVLDVTITSIEVGIGLT